MPFDPARSADLRHELTALDPSLTMLEPEDPGFDAFVTHVHGLDAGLARRLQSASMSGADLEARDIFGTAGPGSPLNIIETVKSRAMGRSVRGEHRIRPLTLWLLGGAAVGGLLLFTAFAPETPRTAETAQAGTSAETQPAATGTPQPQVSAGQDAGSLPTSTVPITPVPITPAPTPAATTTVTADPAPITASDPAPITPPYSSYPVPAAITPAPMPVTPSYPVPAPVRLTTPVTLPTVTASTPPTPIVAARMPAASVKPPSPAVTARVPAGTPQVRVGSPSAAPSQAAQTAATPPVAAPTSTALFAQASGEAPATPRAGLVSQFPQESRPASVAAGLVGGQQSGATLPGLVSAQGAGTSTGGPAGGLVSSGQGVGGSSSSGGLVFASASALGVDAADLISAPSSSAPAAAQPAADAGTFAVSDSSAAPANTLAQGGPAQTPAQNAGQTSAQNAPGLSAAALPYRPGDVVDVKLDTGVIVYPGATHPVWARGADGGVWRGVASLDDASGRVQISFNAVMRENATWPVSAYAESSDGAGIGNHVKTVSKDAARAALSGLLSGAVDFVKSQAQASTAYGGGGLVVQSQRPQNFWLAVGGGVAGAFVVPDIKAQNVQLAQLARGEAISIRVDSAAASQP